MSSTSTKTSSCLIKIRVAKILGLNNIENSDNFFNYKLTFKKSSICFKKNEAESLNFIIYLHPTDLSSFQLNLFGIHYDDSLSNIGYIDETSLSIRENKEISVQRVKFTSSSTASVYCQLVIHYPPEVFKYKKLKEFSSTDFDFEKSITILETSHYTLVSALHIKTNKRYIVKKYKFDVINKSQDYESPKYLTVKDIRNIRNTKNYDTLLPIAGFIRFKTEEEVVVKSENEDEIILPSEIKVKERGIVRLNEEGNPFWSILDGHSSVEDGVDGENIENKANIYRPKLNEEGNPFWSILDGHSSVEDDEEVENIENKVNIYKPKLNEEGNPVWSILDGHSSVENDDIDESNILTRSLTDEQARTMEEYKIDDDDENDEKDEKDDIVGQIVYYDMDSSPDGETSSVISLENLLYNPTKETKCIGNNSKTRIMYQIAHAIYRLHYLGVAHRHLNTNNILINTKTLKVKLIDYEVSTEIIGKDLNNIIYSQDDQYKDNEYKKNNYYDEEEEEEEYVDKEKYSDDFAQIRLDLASDILALGLIYFEISTRAKKARILDKDKDIIYLSSNLVHMFKRMTDKNPNNRPYIEEVLHLFETVDFGIYDTQKDRILQFIHKHTDSIPKGLSFLMQIDEQAGNFAVNPSGLLAFKAINKEPIQIDKFTLFTKDNNNLFMMAYLGYLTSAKKDDLACMFNSEDYPELGDKLLDKCYKNKKSGPDYHFCLFNFDDETEEVTDFSLWWQYQQIRTGMKDAIIYFSDFSKHKISDKYVNHINKVAQLLHEDKGENPYVSFSLAMLLYQNKLIKNKKKYENIVDLITESVGSYVTRSLTYAFLNPTEEFIEEKLVGVKHNSKEIIEELSCYYFNINDLKNAKEFSNIGSANKIGHCELIRGKIYEKNEKNEKAQVFFERAKKHGQDRAYIIFDDDINFDEEEEEEEKEKEEEKDENENPKNKFEFNSDNEDKVVTRDAQDKRFAYNSDDSDVNTEVEEIEKKRHEDEEAERIRKEEEAERIRQEEEAERIRKEEEAERIRKEEEAERIRQEEEAERIRQEEEEERIRKEEEAERIRQEEEAERIRKEEEEERIRKEEEAERIRQEEEAERIRKEEEAEKRRKEEEEEAERIRHEEMSYIQERSCPIPLETYETFDDVIERFIEERDASGLIHHLHSLNDNNLTNSVFNRLYQTDLPFYGSLIECGVEIDNPVSLHKKALSLLLTPDNDNDEFTLKTNYKKARSLLQKSIDLGFDLSYFTLSRLLHEHYSEDNQAFKLAREGAKKGEKYSKALLGHYVSRGIGTNKNFERGILMMLDSGALDYYERFSSDIGIYYAKKDEAKDAFKWFERDYSNHKTKASINNYGVCLLLGYGTDKNVAEAEEVFRDGASNCNDVISLYHLAFILEDRGDFDESFRLYKEAAEKGCSDAQAKYAYLLSEKESTDNYKESKKYFKLAADNGHVTSHSSFGFLTENDNSDTSLEYYKRAAAKGDKDAQEFLAIKFSKEDDPENTFKYMNMCIQSGKHIVPLEYAKKLYSEKQFEQAYKYFNLIAETNNPAGLYFKASMLYSGYGCKEDKDESYNVMKKLADKNVRLAAEFIEDNFKD